MSVENYNWSLHTGQKGLDLEDKYFLDANGDLSDINEEVVVEALNHFHKTVQDYIANGETDNLTNLKEKYECIKKLGESSANERSLRFKEFKDRIYDVNYEFTINYLKQRYNKNTSKEVIEEIISRDKYIKLIYDLFASKPVLKNHEKEAILNEFPVETLDDRKLIESLKEDISSAYLTQEKLNSIIGVSVPIKHLEMIKDLYNAVGWNIQKRSE